MPEIPPFEHCVFSIRLLSPLKFKCPRKGYLFKYSISKSTPDSIFQHLKFFSCSLSSKKSKILYKTSDALSDQGPCLSLYLYLPDLPFCLIPHSPDILHYKNFPECTMLFQPAFSLAGHSSWSSSLPLLKTPASAVVLCCLLSDSFPDSFREI